MASTSFLDLEADDKIAAAFAAPTEGRSAGDLAVLGRGGAVAERIVTAQVVPVPRDDAKILQKIRALAAGAGEDWFYRFPVRDKDGRKFIEGPSIKCANNVARLYGNCEIDTRAIDIGNAWIIYARFIDWETGFSMTRPFEQSKTQATIKTPDQARAQSNAFQIGVSKSIRNVVCNALEQFTTFAFEESQRNLVDKVGKRLEEYRKRVLAALEEMKIETKRVEAVLGRAAANWLAPDVARVIAEIQAVKDGMATADETWPPPAPDRPTREQFRDQPGATPSSSPATAEPEKKAETAKPQETKPAEFSVTDMDGEVKAFTKVPELLDYVLGLIAEAEKRGRQAVEGLEESNEALLQQLRDADLGDTALALSRAFAKAFARAATPKQAKGDLLDEAR